MIKLPDEVVYYAEPQRAIEVLLCWIPAHAYPQLAVDDATAAELLRWYPRGLEVAVDETSARELGIRLGADERDLRRAYQWLQDSGALPSSRMVSAETLDALAAEYGAGGFEAGDQPWLERPDLPAPPAVTNEPAMTLGTSTAAALALLAGEAMPVAGQNDDEDGEAAA